MNTLPETPAPVNIAFTRCPSANQHKGSPFNPSWHEFCSALADPLQIKIADKTDKLKKLPCIALGQFKNNYVNSENAVSLSALGLDIEAAKDQAQGFPPSFGEGVESLRSMGISFAAYSTLNHSISKPRYRVIFPLNGTIAPRLAAYAYRILWAALPDSLVPFADRSCNKAERLFIMPCVQPHADYQHAFHDAEVLGTGSLADGALILEAQATRATHKTPRPARSDSIIDAFNGRVTVREMLEASGYKRIGRKYLAPKSTTGLPGVIILSDGRAYSHHANDPLNTGHAHDAFSVFATLYHEGSATKAAAALFQETAA